MHAASTDALTLHGVSKHFGEIVAVSDVDLAVPRGKLVCFLGPSGCGKTTLLRLIAGLELPTGGEVRLRGKDITHLPAHRRNLGMVFQSLALFPHLSVADNIAYGIRIRGHDKAAQRRRADELLTLVRLPETAGRHVSQLSGGQRQRVAIARALALEPELFLLDEPLSALDAKLREEMQVELKLLLQQVGVTTILVTHDQREAMTMADLIVVMRDGKVQQVGSALEIYRNPANTFVAEFIGTSNLLRGEVQADERIRVQDHLLHAALPEHAREGAPVTVSIRPEDVHILVGEQAGENLLSGTVAFVRDVGQSVEIYVDCGETRITAQVQPRDKPDAAQGDRVTVELPKQACVVLDR